MFGNDLKIGLSSILLPVNKLILNTNLKKIYFNIPTFTVYEQLLYEKHSDILL